MADSKRTGANAAPKLSPQAKSTASEGGVMQISEERQKQLKDDFGICANEACDNCKKILAEVRWTKRNTSGEWCSRECRDGLDLAAKTRERIDARRARLVKRVATPAMLAGLAKARQARSNRQKQAA